MKTIHILFLFFLVVPFIEIYLLLEVGSIIGALPTIFLVVLTAVLGAHFLRKQGLATWQRFQISLRQGTLPAYELIEGPIILIGAALLLTPGFFTDLLGFACLVPSLRRRIADFIIEKQLLKGSLGGFFAQKGTGSQEQIIEGEFRKKSD